MMLKIAICDDEEYYIEKVKEGLKKYLARQNEEGYQIDVYNSGEELCENQEGLKEYQVVFLDVEMNQISGMEAAQIIKSVNQECCLVFVTAFIDYAMEGYKVQAIRYLLKKDLDSNLSECIEAVLQKIDFDNQKERFAFQDGQRELLINQILYLESDRHKLVFHVKGKKEQLLTSSGKLDDMQKRLEPYGFIRIHKSFLVNVEKIVLIKNYRVILENGEELPVPREKFRQVKEQYLEMEGRI